MQFKHKEQLLSYIGKKITLRIPNTAYPNNPFTLVYFGEKPKEIHPGILKHMTNHPCSVTTCLGVCSL